jgi:hypothetical protein
MKLWLQCYKLQYGGFLLFYFFLSQLESPNTIMKGIVVYHFNVPKGCVQSVRGPNHYLLCRCLYTLGLYDCLHKNKLRWNEAYPHKLVAAWMNILLTFYFIDFHSWAVTISWLSLIVISKNATIIQETYLHNNLPFFGQIIIHLFTPSIKSWWS